MSGVALGITKFLFIIVGILVSPFIIIALIIFLKIVIHIIKLKKQGYKRIQDDRIIIKKSKAERIFKELPCRLAKDYMLRDPYDFKEYGLHVFCGRQGSGKSIGVVELLIRLKEKYPKCKIRTNMAYKYEDGELYHWEQMVDNSNGKYGQIEVLDEIQNWFNSNDSKNFPYEMLTEISQQRKQRKMLLGTAQVFSRIAKPIREQITFVYLPRTYLGCLTIVKLTRPEYWDNEKQIFKQHEGRYFFVHSDKIRNAFDTYKKIKRYQKIGFQRREVQSETIVNIQNAK